MRWQLPATPPSRRGELGASSYSPPLGHGLPHISAGVGAGHCTCESVDSARLPTPATGRAFVDYFTGTASGWPFGAIITTKLLYGAVVLAFRGISTVWGGTQCASPALR